MPNPNFKNSRTTPLAGGPNQPYMQEYLEELEAQLRSKDYIRVVRNGLTHFSNYCDREQIMHPVEITRAHLIRYQLLTNTYGWSRKYQIQMMTYVRGWMNWMLRLNYLKLDPWEKVRIGVYKKEPKPLDDEEVAQLFAAHKQGAFNMDPFSFHRREMMLACLFGWGLRTFELAGLTVTAMDVRQDWVIAPNKGGGTKQLPYADEIKKVFSRYSALRARFSKTGIDALIITQHGDAMPRETISKTISRLGTLAGVDLNAHMLRDTAATTMLDNDVPLEHIAKVLGHTSTRQTIQYAKVRDRKVAESHTRVMDPQLRVLFNSTGNLAT